MAYLTKAERDILIITSATLFAKHTRDANEIAALLGTTERTVHRWSKESLWHQTLDTLGYESERNFRVQPARDSVENPNFEVVETAYLAAIEQGVPKHKRVSLVSKQTGVNDWTVRNWAKKFGWDNERSIS